MLCVRFFIMLQLCKPFFDSNDRLRFKSNQFVACVVYWALSDEPIDSWLFTVYPFSFYVARLPFLLPGCLLLSPRNFVSTVVQMLLFT